MGILDIFGRKKPGQIGLDIGSYSLKLVRIEQIGGQAKLTGLGFREFGKGVIVDKEIHDQESLIYSLQGLVEEIDPEMSDFVISVAGKKVFSDRFTLNSATNKQNELYELVMTEAEQRIPTGLENLSLDYYVLSMDTKKKQTEIVMVTAYEDFIRNYIDTIIAGGYNVIAIDADYFALFNAFEHSMGVPPEGVIALLNIGHTLTNLVIIADGRFYSARDISTGTRDVWDRLQRELRLSTDELTPLVRGDTEWFDADKLKNAMYLGVDDLKIGIDMAFAYFENISGGRKVEKVYLSGGGAIIPYLPDALSAKLELPYDIIDPFKRIEVDPAVFTYSTQERVGPLFTVAVGLALREV